MVAVNIAIRKAAETDRAGIFTLLEQANMHRVPSPEVPELTYENYFVAKDGDEIVGFCGYKILSPTEGQDRADGGRSELPR